MDPIPEHLQTEDSALAYLSEILKTHGEDFYEKVDQRTTDGTLSTSFLLIQHESALIVRIVSDMIKHLVMKDAKVGHYLVDELSAIPHLLTVLRDETRTSSWGHVLDILCILSGDCGTRPEDVVLTGQKYIKLHEKSCQQLFTEDVFKLTHSMFDHYLKADHEEWLESEKNSIIDPLGLLNDEERKLEEEYFEPQTNTTFTFAIAQVYLNLAHAPNIEPDTFRLLVDHTTQFFLKLTPEFSTELQMWSTTLTRIFEVAGGNAACGDVFAAFCCRLEGQETPECPLVDYIFKLITQPYVYPVDGEPKWDDDVTEEQKQHVLQENQRYMSWLGSTLLLALLRLSSNPHFNAIIIFEHLEYFNAIFNAEKFDIKPFIDISKETQDIISVLQDRESEIQKVVLEAAALKRRHLAQTKAETPEQKQQPAKGKAGGKKAVVPKQEEQEKLEPLTEEEVALMNAKEEEIKQLYKELQEESVSKQEDINGRQAKLEPFQVMMTSELYNHVLICNILLTNVDRDSILDEEAAAAEGKKRGKKANVSSQSKSTSNAQKNLLNNPNLRRGGPQQTKLGNTQSENESSNDPPEQLMEFTLLRRPNQIVILQHLFPHLDAVDATPANVEDTISEIGLVNSTRQNYFTLISKSIALLPFLRDEETFASSQETLHDAWQCVNNILQYAQFFISAARPEMRLEAFKKTDSQGNVTLSSPFTPEQEECYATVQVVDVNNTTDLHVHDITKPLLDPYHEQKIRAYKNAKRANDEPVDSLPEDLTPKNPITSLHHALSLKFVTSYCQLLYSNEFYESLRHLFTFTFLQHDGLVSILYAFVRGYGDFLSLVKFHHVQAAKLKAKEEEAAKESEVEGNETAAEKKLSSNDPSRIVDLLDLSSVDYKQAVSQFRLCVLIGLRSNITLTLLFRESKKSQKIQKEQQEILSFYNVILVTTNVLEYNIYDGKITDEQQRAALAKYFGDIFPIDQFPSSEQVVETQKRAFIEDLMKQQREAEQQAKFIKARGTKKQKKELQLLQQQSTSTSQAATKTKTAAKGKAKNGDAVSRAFAAANLSLPSGSF